jgi:antitoxin component YwqK of YwqJK toxin-antitoxin module
MKEITNRNSKGLLHGYQERYYSNGKLGYKCFYNNGKLDDYEEFYNINFKLEKAFHI